MDGRSDKEKDLDEIPGTTFLPHGMAPSGFGPSATSMGPGPVMDPYSMTDGQEGYDYVFHPHLDSKYECPICLMCLREPVQTECGHRFCRSCITRSLRDAGRRCPIDNFPLTEQRFFPDVCVKREILDLKAQCPFRDCPESVELRNMDIHQADCRYGTYVCPQLCGGSVRRKSLDNHLQHLCPKRRVPCDHCSLAVPLDELQVHVDACTMAPCSCIYCGEDMLQEQLQTHVKTECPAVVVDCRYKSAGCLQNMERQLMGDHLNTEMQLHMDLLASRLDQMNLAANPSSFNPYQPLPDASWAADFEAASNQNEYPSAKYHQEVSYNKMHGVSAPNTIEIEKYGANTLDQNRLEKAYAGGGMMPVGSKVAEGLQRHSSCMNETDPNVDVELRHLKEKVQILQRDIVMQNQEILVLRATAERGQQDAKKVKELSESLGNLEARLCNGDFIWRLHGYSNMLREVQRGETSVRHSKGFYTGFCGYKLCLRVNINVSESSHNSHVSLFVHFLKGEFDDLLEWPFNGKITLVIMDQDTDCSKRKPISETLFSKPELAAFHRPRTHRNHKGFGYMEFAPVNMLETGTFLKDDNLLIRVLVEVKS